jgi:hypothetical protein
MDNLSEKTQEILKAAGIDDYEVLRDMDREVIWFHLYYRTFGINQISELDIEHAADEIAALWEK